MSFVTRSFCALVVLCGMLTAHAEAATLTVNAGGDLQAAINRATPGDQILLPPGATFTGLFTLPRKPDVGGLDVVIRTARILGPAYEAGLLDAEHARARILEQLHLFRAAKAVFGAS